MVGMFIIGRLQDPQQLPDRREVTALGGFDDPLTQMVAQHKFWVGTQHRWPRIQSLAA
ncbi:MAG: hypothetical protein RIT26_235, partial [Pseudomonadota bacterium]